MRPPPTREWTVKARTVIRWLASVAATVLAIVVVGEAPLRASAEMSGAGAATRNPAAATAAQIIATAQRYIGYPYASIGDDPATGFSCIGFAHFVVAQHGIYVP